MAKLSKISRTSAASLNDLMQACKEVEFLPWDCEKPVIAMVRGYCLAGSCELAMMCCVTFAGESAVFGEPEIRFSTAPPVVVMPWLVGLKKARELLYTGDSIDAREALALGMVNRVFPDEELEAETTKYARRAAAISLEGLKTTKAAINRGAEIAGFRQAVDYGVEMGAILDSTPTAVYRKFKEITEAEGLTAAIRWRESQFE
jgi:enoyl-CoA hydratase